MKSTTDKCPDLSQSEELSEACAIPLHGRFCRALQNAGVFIA